MFEKGGPPGPGRRKGSELEMCMKLLRSNLRASYEPGVTYREQIIRLLVHKAAEGKEPFLGYVLRRLIPEQSILKVEGTIGREMERPAEIPTTDERLAELAKLHAELGDGVLH